MAGYAACELRRLVREHRGIRLPPTAGPGEPAAALPADDLIVLGTCDASPAAARLLRDGFLPRPAQPQGYAMRAAAHPADSRRWLLAIVGSDAAGALYALRDLEHYHLRALAVAGGRLEVAPFARRDHPSIAYRGHWVWGCNMPDKRAWIENMSRWKLNELIHWDNTPPADARALVAYAHTRAVRVVWGFGWGWAPEWNYTLPPDFDRGVGPKVEMCGSSEGNRRFFQREILRKVREIYAPTGCDGIYFQSFTECPKCRCPRCAGRTMGEIMLEFVNPIVDAIKRDFPDLWISCGIHHDFGDYSHLERLDPRCNIYWENCASGTSVRGEDEDFGYLYKSIPYGHGYSKTCPADPPYTEASLQEWMTSNAERYQVGGGLATHIQYMRFLQRWARRFQEKRSANTHAGVVADHSVFCRRTPFPHVALAEAQWNCDADAAATVGGILDCLHLREEVARRPDPACPLRDPQGKPPWLCPPEVPAAGTPAREGHDA